MKIWYNKVMFVDTAKVSLKAGKGGDGAVSFRHEIYVPKGGPDGGDGGKGGDIIFRADKDTNTLIDFRFTPILEAEPGKNGSGQRSAGRSGKDLIIEVPIGTSVYKISDLGLSETVRDDGSGIASEPRNDGRERSGPKKVHSSKIPTISLSKDALKDTWRVEKKDDKFVVTGEKIEKFARRTDLNNYASVNRLRDIMKKLGIRAELTTQGAKPDSIISIAGKEFTLVEDW